jgi:serine beta-lactamase-like protein LACTB, mitochondrial
MRYLFLLLAFTLSVNSFSQKNKSPYQKAISAARDSVRKVITKRPIPGASITVSIDGKIVWSEGFGFADLEQHVPVIPSKSKFRIGSISKALTATGLARLYEQNKVILDSSIYFYLPDYPKHKYRPTVRQVAGHIAGVRHYKGNEWYSAHRYNTVSEGLTMFKDDSLLHQPGSKYQYTSHGFNLLSAVIEKAAGKEFLPFMNDEVIGPLQLKNTIADLNDSIIDSRTRFYDVRNGRWINSPYADNSYKWAGGGFISTSEDINRFGNALLRNDFLKPETIKLFTTPQQLNDGSFTSYGMGFFSGKDSKQLAYFGHSGGSVGGTCDMVIYPNQKIVVVILTNVSDAQLGSIARKVAHEFMK